MRGLVVAILIGLVTCAGQNRPVFAAAAEDLRQAAQAIAQRDLDAANAACRRAFEAADATRDQRGQALDGLFIVAVERGRLADLRSYFEQRRTTAPDEQKAPLLSALARCQKAADGHLAGAVALLEREGSERSGSAARYLYREATQLGPTLQKSVERLAREMSSATAHRPWAAETPRRSGGERHVRSVRLVEVPAPKGPDYELRLVQLGPPQRSRLRGAIQPIVLRPPEAPRLRAEAPASVTKPTAQPRVRSERLAAALFNQAYQKATELAGDGLVDSAKAEYATLMQLFPDSPQTQQAARYALALFQRQRGAADPLAAYLRWIRAVLGPQGSEAAEHLAFTHLAHSADPAVLAREAEEFLKRHPDTKYAAPIRLQLAIALDSIGSSAKAIEVLKPIVSPIDDALRAKAAHILAWLYIFQGDAAQARHTLEALAAQTVAPESAAQARQLLEGMAAHPLPKLTVADVEGGDPDESLASRLLDAADALLRKGDAERAMDLYELYLRLGSRDTPGFLAARARIERLKRTGRADEE
jgi:hypothetical protein